MFWVWGGSTLNLLALWRLHGLDEPLREAYERGAVLCGMSAGMNCWFESCTTDSYGLELAPLHDGLGFLAGSACPHYDGEPQRRPLYRRLVDAGALGPGWAADNDAALHFAGGELVEAVTLRDGRRAPTGSSPAQRSASPPGCSSSPSSPASSSTVTPSRSAFSSLEPGDAPATT